jgi:hypothetical protein
MTPARNIMYLIIKVIKLNITDKQFKNEFVLS